jgi:hypothetical protein
VLRAALVGARMRLSLLGDGHEPVQSTEVGGASVRARRWWPRGLSPVAFSVLGSAATPPRAWRGLEV